MEVVIAAMLERRACAKELWHAENVAAPGAVVFPCEPNAEEQWKT
jgi:hypothetical protein